MWYLLSSNVRLALLLIGVVGALALPPWVPLLVMLALSLRFAAWEAVALGFLVDILWFTPAASGSIVQSFPFFTIVGLVLAWGLHPLRNELLT